MTLVSPTITDIGGMGLLYVWGNMKGGDEGARVEAWAWPQLCFHLTGNTEQHIVDVLGSNDGSCFGPLLSLSPLPNWVDDRLHDTLVNYGDLPRVRWFKVMVRGSGNVPDCSVALYGSRHF